MRFDIITIFPKAFSYLNESIIKRAADKKLLEIHIHDLRAFAHDKHRRVDDRPYGGGAGMVMKVEPIYRAVEHIKKITARKKYKKTRIILLAAKGKRFVQKKGRQMAHYEHIIFICGHYEGVDERVAGHIADEELSIGDYVLTGGELPAMVALDAIVRHIPGVIKKASLEQESFGVHKGRGVGLEYPHYTRPESFISNGNKNKKMKPWVVPKVLLSGDYAKIEQWKEIHKKSC
jgi:tRNA (guanine37-N1)-methyltransferase